MFLLYHIWFGAIHLGALLLQAGGGENAIDFSLVGMIRKMGATAIAVVVILLIMSIYSIAIMVERLLTFNAARNQSKEFAPKVAQSLKQSRIDEAISISDKYKKSHLAMVVNAGLQEFQAHQAGDISGEEIEASKRALQRAEAIKLAEFRRGLSGLATIGSTAPFVGLFGTVVGIIIAFEGLSQAASASIQAVAPGIAEALVATAAGIAAAVPAVLAYNHYLNRIKLLAAEMDGFALRLLNFIEREAQG